MMKQRGYNSAYPEEIDIWSPGLPVPEWLSDIAAVKFMDGEGNLTLETIPLSEGGFEVKGSDGQILIRTSGVVCYGGGRLFGLSHKQLRILYEE